MLPGDTTSGVDNYDCATLGDGVKYVPDGSSTDDVGYTPCGVGRCAYDYETMRCGYGRD